MAKVDVAVIPMAVTMPEMAMAVPEVTVPVTEVTVPVTVGGRRRRTEGTETGQENERKELASTEHDDLLCLRAADRP